MASSLRRNQTVIQGSSSRVTAEEAALAWRGASPVSQLPFAGAVASSGFARRACAATARFVVDGAARVVGGELRRERHSPFAGRASAVPGFAAVACSGGPDPVAAAACPLLAAASVAPRDLPVRSWEAAPKEDDPCETNRFHRVHPLKHLSDWVGRDWSVGWGFEVCVRTIRRFRG